VGLSIKHTLCITQYESLLTAFEKINSDITGHLLVQLSDQRKNWTAIKDITDAHNHIRWVSCHHGMTRP